MNKKEDITMSEVNKNLENLGDEQLGMWRAACPRNTSRRWT